MKITTEEYNEWFSFSFEAENMQEAAFLTRFGLNRASQISSANSHVNKAGNFTAEISFPKRKRGHGGISRKS